MLGASQLDGGKAVGVCEKTAQTWEHTVWWPQAQAEARRRWLQGVEAGAMRGVLKALDDPEEYAAMSRWAAEKVIPEIMNASQGKVDDGSTSRVYTVTLTDDTAPKEPVLTLQERDEDA